MADEPKVVALNGGFTVQPGQVSDKFVTFLEDQLERAKAGDTIGFAGEPWAPLF